MLCDHMISLLDSTSEAEALVSGSRPFPFFNFWGLQRHGGGPTKGPLKIQEEEEATSSIHPPFLLVQSVLPPFTWHSGLMPYFPYPRYNTESTPPFQFAPWKTCPVAAPATPKITSQQRIAELLPFLWLCSENHTDLLYKDVVRRNAFRNTKHFADPKCQQQHSFMLDQMLQRNGITERINFIW